MTHLSKYTRFGFMLFMMLIVNSFSNTYASESTVVASQNLVNIKDAWVRPSHPGQDTGAAYMTFTSKENVTLTHIESEASESTKIHSMTMHNGVMKMRMLDNLPLLAGEPYKLEPGGFHLMLLNLKKTLNAGDSVNFVLYFKTKNQTEFKQSLTIQVAPETDPQH